MIQPAQLFTALEGLAALSTSVTQENGREHGLGDGFTWDTRFRPAHSGVWVETTLTAEEKLLSAIVGEKASDVKDTSLRVDQGSQGTVIDVQVFTREGITRDRRAQQIIDDELKRFRLDLNDQLRIVEADAFDRIEKLLMGRVANGGPQKLAKGTKIDKAYLSSVEKFHWFDIRPSEDDVAAQLESIKNSIEQQRHSFDLGFEEKRKKLKQGDKFPSGELKMVKG